MRPYFDDVAVMVVEEISAANGGRLPVTPGQLAALFGRFGGRLCWVGEGVLPAPVLRGCVVYLPCVAPGRGELDGWLAHELAEIVLCWEGRAPWHGPGLPGDRHVIAGLVERRLLEAAAAREH